MYRQIILSRIFLLIFLGYSGKAFSQLNNTMISDQLVLEKSDSNTVGLSLGAFSYMRNTEYFNDIELGRTLFGYQLTPAVYIQPNQHVKMQAGVFLKHDFGGKNPYTTVLPTFTVKMKTEKGNEFIFGTLEGALSHRLIEPMFDINSAIENRIENGFQFKKENATGYYDIWINWEQYIERGSPYKEQFVAGYNLSPYLFKTEAGSSLELSTQFTAFHRGGQIDTDSSNMAMLLNGAIGLVATKTFKGTIKEIKADFHGVHSVENTSSGLYPFKNGYGVYTNLSVSTANFTGMLSYWSGNKYVARKGTAIYQSVSLDKPGLTQPNRQLLFLRFMYQKEIYPKLFLVARAEPVYEIKNSILDYSYSLYITYRQQIGLGKLLKVKP